MSPASNATLDDALILHNLGLARTLANKAYRRRQHAASPAPVLLDDLMQEGMVGLLKAAQRFDPGRGFKFSTYAWPAILNTIRQAIDKDDRQTHRMWHDLDGASRDDLGELAREDTSAEHLHDREQLRPLLAALPAKTRKAITLKFGLDGRSDRSFAQVGAVMRLSKQRVAQLVEKGLKSMRQMAGR